MPRIPMIGVVAIAASTAAVAVSLVLVNASPRPEPAGPLDGSRPAPPPLPKPVPVPRQPVARPPTESAGAADRRASTLAAIVEPAETVEVVPDVSGQVGRLAVGIGSIVRRGDLLAEIEAPDRHFALARARVAVQQARARIATARAGVKVATSAVQTARAELESSQAELQQTQANSSYRKRQYERIAELVKKGALQNRIGEEEKARIRGDVASELAARSNVSVRRASLLSAEAKLEAAQAEVAEREEGARLAEVELEEAKQRLESCRVHASIDGIVARQYHHVGDHVRSVDATGSGALFTLVQAGTVRVVAQVPDRDAIRVVVGASAAFRPDSDPRAESRGTVSRTSVAEDPATQTMRIEVDLDNADGRLRPGQRGSLRIDLRPAP